MIPLDYSMEVTFVCGPRDANVATFTEAASIIGGHNTIEGSSPAACGHLARNLVLRWRRRRPPVEGCGADASGYSYYWGARARDSF
jgi:hypothetical protein